MSHALDDTNPRADRSTPSRSGPRSQGLWPPSDVGLSSPDDVAGRSRRWKATTPRGRPRAGPDQARPARPRRRAARRTVRPRRAPRARGRRRYGSAARQGAAAPSSIPQVAPASSPSTEPPLVIVAIRLREQPVGLRRRSPLQLEDHRTGRVVDSRGCPKRRRPRVRRRGPRRQRAPRPPRSPGTAVSGPVRRHGGGRPRGRTSRRRARQPPRGASWADAQGGQPWSPPPEDPEAGSTTPAVRGPAPYLPSTRPGAGDLRRHPPPTAAIRHLTGSVR